MLFTSDRPVKELNDFVDYVWSFYGEHDDTIYPIFGLKKKDIYDAFFVYQERIEKGDLEYVHYECCLLYTSPSPRDRQKSRMPSSA